jgi:Fe-S cluster assembly protein SufB
VLKNSKDILNEKIIRMISGQKNESKWMLESRLKALACFNEYGLPDWGPCLSSLRLQDLRYYINPGVEKNVEWGEIPKDIREKFDKSGLSDSEKKGFGGLGAQYESEMIYHDIKKKWQDMGVVFCSIEDGLAEHEDLFREYFGSVVSMNDNKFAALNSSVWSGGSFVYVPKGVRVTMPLQTFFRMDSNRMGQFERTLIIADEGSEVNYVEGCTAQNYRAASLHSAVVEVIAKPRSKIRYNTIQNWSKNVYNLVTKRAMVFRDAVIEWIDCNIGSGITMKYPGIILREEGAKSEIISLSMASCKKQIIDSGAKAIHLADNTSSRIISKSICKDGGCTAYRGLVKICNGAKNCKSFTQCDALILGNGSQANAYPILDAQGSSSEVGHEATVSRINDDQLFYLMSRGIDRQGARNLIVNGFIEPFVKTLPLEFAVEMNRLVELEMEDSVG